MAEFKDRDLHLVKKALAIAVLAIERQGEIIPNPQANTIITLGDKLICFGKLENIRNTICVNLA